MATEEPEVDMIIDPPVGPFSTREELLAWQKTVEGYPDCYAKELALVQVAEWLSWQDDE